MLDVLRIENFALIDELQTELGPGLNIMTGETGAGKSIIVGALNLVLGMRASSDAVRSGAAQARIEALFNIEAEPRVIGLIEELGFASDDNQLVLARIISKEGRSRCYVNGALATLGAVARIGNELVDFHGQHEHQSLLRTEKQMELLDGYAGLSELRCTLAERYGELLEIRNALSQLDKNERERARQADFLEHEIKEIDAARLEPSEEEQLRERKKLVANAEKLVSLSAQAYALLYADEGSMTERLTTLRKSLEELAGIDASFKGFLEYLSEMDDQLGDLAFKLRDYSSTMEFDPGELDAIENRLRLVNALKRKYGDSIAVILEHRDKCERELDGLRCHDERLAELEKQEQKALAECLALAKKVSGKRKRVARELATKVRKEIEALGMEKGEFEARLSRRADDELVATGLDDLEFMFSANPGEPVKPLKEVASGGEISRVMLALKTVLAGADDIPTLVFDEIDAGVGGATAKTVGAKLSEVARSHQVVCITHLPQIAASADNHIRVTKEAEGERMVTRAASLDEEERVKEIATLLDGRKLSEISLQHARELLKR
jgi:DNA repair protein RecN (Recombination protein N)